MGNFEHVLKAAAAVEGTSPVRGLIGRERAAVTVRLGFPDGGFRVCSKDKKFQKLTIEEIVEFICNGIPKCLICGGRTELMTPEEKERIKP